MKYTYFYKSSDGVRHEAAMDAPSREVVFETLRKQGIKAIKVVAADGSKANGEIRGVRKRMVAMLGALCLVLGAVVAGVFAFRVGVRGGEEKATLPFNDTTRRQLIGDAAVIEKGVLTGWSETFPEEGERFFASFAVPGVKAGQRNTTVDELNAALARTVQVEEKDGLEARQIKAMVEGMKREARAYIAAGGTVIEYGKRLTERQDAEIAIYERTKSEIEQAKKTLKDKELVAFWEKRNDQLRNLGIKLISLED